MTMQTSTSWQKVPERQKTTAQLLIDECDAIRCRLAFEPAHLFTLGEIMHMCSPVIMMGIDGSDEKSARQELDWLTAMKSEVERRRLAQGYRPIAG